MYDPATRTWTDLTIPASGSRPSPRDSHGFTGAGGKLYVFGGEIGNGGRGCGCMICTGLFHLMPGRGEDCAFELPLYAFTDLIELLHGFDSVPRRSKCALILCAKV